jgi:tripartite-type tricarboxylate transporter receptor subunit TctC
MRMIGYALALAASLACAMQAHAQADFYAGKRIQMIIGFTPGGGVDTYGRIMARHLGRHIPGNPTIVPQNMPGAAGVTALRALETAQPKDGTVMATFTPGLVVLSFTTPEQVDIDFSRFQWLGSVGQDRRICYTWHETGVKTWDEFMKRREVVLGDTGGDWSTRSVQKLLGAPIKLVRGYPGSAEKRLAIQRGELDGDCGAMQTFPPDWIRDNKINAVLRFQEATRGLPPMAVYFRDLLKDDPTKRQIFELLISASDIGRSFVMSKDVPAERVAILREAVAKTMADPEYIADLEKVQLDPTPTHGDVLQARVKALYETPPEIVAAARKLMAQ